MSKVINKLFNWLAAFACIVGGLIGVLSFTLIYTNFHLQILVIKSKILYKIETGGGWK